MLRRTAGSWGPAGFAAASLVAARRLPGYSHRRHHVSGLAARGQPSAPVMVAGFIVLAAAQAVVSVPTPQRQRLTRVAAASTLAAGVIQVSDPRCPQPDDPDATIGDLGHGAASVATFVLWTSMPFVAMRESGEQRHGRLARVLALPTVVAMVVAGVTTRRDSSFKGAAQRAFLALVFSFFAATGLATEAPGHS